MLSTALLVPKLTTDFPDIAFVAGATFHWHPEKLTVTYVTASNDIDSLLHEVAHAILGHQDFKRDVELIEMERDAWRYATTTLAPRYGHTITPEIIEDSLDSYRDWLHARSTCPTCKATGIQTKQHTYKCLACMSEWTVNDARQHALRRHLTKKYPR